MYFSGKSLLATIFAVGISVSGCMPTHVRVDDSHTMDDARARLILKTVPGFDMSQVWFATGAEYWSSGTCLDGRDTYAFTKPKLSSPGIWRGKKAYISQPVPGVKSKCADPNVFDYRGFDIDTASFSDPDSMRPEEAWDGALPGVFQIYDGITDDELSKIAVVIGQVPSCYRKQSTCPYPITLDDRYTPSDSDIAVGVSTANLLTLNVDNDYEAGKPCYSIVFQKGTYEGALGMDICYRNEAVSKVVLGGMILE